MSFRRSDYLEVGTDISGYRIVSVLNAGGFGILYRAVATGRRALDVQRKLGPRAVLSQDGLPIVALKEFFPSGLAVRENETLVVSEENRSVYDSALGKFITESQRLITLFDHPNIVKGVELIAVRGTYFFSMEFVVGRTLSEWLSQYHREHHDPPSETEIRAIFDPLLEAVETVHGLDQMHRDITPGNVLIRKDGTPVLIDFGLVGEGLDRERRGTLIALTPGYAPPEQSGTQFMPFDGKIVDLRRQGTYTDVYSLCAVLFRCMTGSPPPSSDMRIDKMVNGETDPADLALANAGKRYPETMIEAVAAGMRLPPSARLQTVIELRKAIGWTDPLPPTAAPVQPALYAEVSTPALLAPAPRVDDAPAAGAPNTLPAPPAPPVAPAPAPLARAPTEPAVAPPTPVSAAEPSPPPPSPSPAPSPPAAQAPRPIAQEAASPARGRPKRLLPIGLAAGGLAAVLALTVAIDPLGWRDTRRVTVERTPAVELSPIEQLRADIARVGDADVAVEMTDGTLVLTGRVTDDAARMRITEFAAQRFPGVPRRDGIETDTGVRAVILSTLRRLGAEDVVAQVTGTAVTLTGRVATRDDLARLVGEVRPTAGRRALEARVEVDADVRQAILDELARLGVSSVRVEVGARAATVSGFAPSQVVQETARESLRRIVRDRTLDVAIMTATELQRRVEAQAQAIGGSGVRVEADAASIRLFGRTTTEAMRRSLLGAIAATAEGRRVVDDVSADETVRARLEAALAPAARRTVTVGEAIEIDAVFPEERQRTDLEGLARSLAAGRSLNLRLRTLGDLVATARQRLAAIGAADLVVEVVGNGLSVRGRVADEARRTAVVAAVIDAADRIAVRDAVTTWDGVRSAAAAAVNALPEGDRAMVSVADGALRVSGTVATAAGRRAVVAAIQRAAPGERLDDTLSVDAEIRAEAQRILVEARVVTPSVEVPAGRIILRGRLPDDPQRASVIASVARLPGGRSIVDEISTDTGVRARLQDALERERQSGLIVEVAATVLLTGVVADEAARERILALARGQAAGRPVVDQLVTVAQRLAGLRAVVTRIVGDRLTLDQQGGTILLAGRVSDEAVRRQVLEQIAPLIGSLVVDDRIGTDQTLLRDVETVLRADAALQDVTARIAASGVVLGGRVPTPADAQRGVTIATDVARPNLRGREAVSTEISVDTQVASDAIAAARRVAGNAIMVEVGRLVTLAGVVDNAAARDRAVAAVRPLVAGRELQVRTVARDERVAAVRAALAARSVVAGNVEVVGDTLVAVGGTLRSEGEREGVLEAARVAAAPLQIQDRFRVVALPSATPPPRDPAPAQPPTTAIGRPQFVDLERRIETSLMVHGVARPVAKVFGNRAVLISGVAPSDPAAFQRMLQAVTTLADRRDLVNLLERGTTTDPDLNPPPAQRVSLTECDRVTLPPQHPARTAQAPGVPFDLIDGRAESACAVALTPNAPARAELGLGLSRLVTGDYATAERLLAAARREEPIASTFLGWMSEVGLGRGADPTAARAAYLVGARGGDPLAMLLLGRLLLDGTGGPTDRQQALLWFLRAARLGSAAGAFEVGRALEMSDGPASEMSRQWYRNAGRLGHPLALLRLSQLETADVRRADMEKDVVDALIEGYIRGEWDVRRAFDDGLAAYGQGLRVELQRRLAASNAYRGPINGRITPDFRLALDRFANPLP